MTDRELWERRVWVIEVGDRAALATQYQPRIIGGEFDLRWFRGLGWEVR